MALTTRRIASLSVPSEGYEVDVDGNNSLRFKYMPSEFKTQVEMRCSLNGTTLMNSTQNANDYPNKHDF
jgi:hypothetical protein